MIRAAMLALAGLCLAAPVAAQTEVEVDPFAYALHGYSLHVARVVGSTRLNVGIFGADVPHAFHGNDGWKSTMRGAGIKWDFVGRDPNGLFVGFDGGYMRNRYLRTDSLEQRVERGILGLGVRGGYRLPVGSSGLYLSPWVGLSYNFDGDDVEVQGERFERNTIGVFPTVHIGWRF